MAGGRGRASGLFTLQIRIEIAGEQPTEGWCQVGADDLVVIDPDPLEHALVEFAAHGRVAGQVVVLSVREQSHGSIELSLDMMLVGDRLAQLTLGMSLAERDALLLGLE